MTAQPTGALLGNGAASPLAGFLLGYPDLTAIASVLNPTTDSYAKHYAFFAQDDFKVSQSLTLNYGLRWEYHPMFRDHNNNLANFYPNYSSTQDGQTVNGAGDYSGEINLRPGESGFRPDNRTHAYPHRGSVGNSRQLAFFSENRFRSARRLRLPDWR